MIIKNKENSIINDHCTIVTAKQMQEIENRMFTEGMPVASLMEKAALLCSQRIYQEYPLIQSTTVGFIIGSGHNGGDGLVIARELFLKGYQVKLYTPLANNSKDLTAQHLQYARFLNIDFVTDIEGLINGDVIIDCLFGFGLNRQITNSLAHDIILLNQWQKPVISIDIPSGIHTDTGEVLGVAVKAHLTLCLGLWKLGLFQSPAWEYTGKLEKIDLGIPDNLVKEVIHQSPLTQLITREKVKTVLPLPRAVNTHKYRQGNLLLICGSRQYAGAALFSAYGANVSGVGMLTMIIPQSLQPLINSHIPSALVVATKETKTGVMDFTSLSDVDLSKYNTILFGMGITREKIPYLPLQEILTTSAILVIDADGFNYLTEDNLHILSQRLAPTILTPHEGEFKRLFPNINLNKNRLEGLQEAAKKINGTILLKGSKTMISHQGQYNWIIKEGTTALARGGSGDVLSGFLGGLLAQTDFIKHSIQDVVASAGWLHQQGGILAVEDLTELGVDGITLAHYISQSIAILIQNKIN
ncbi:bifunctional ADP-dependent NAD(P)H-hydrate dehydratase/NAD(P)H-hydrate epimerase [Geminocystis sp. NIES-3709]|uniref:bifunctional ADP-dependent NAD(P)H-hydrate dehydratase/NAD(P)H-hydrate epimerase n=1 Tax=Geminocystis sp. NIES-3709 TaxID=1617448 RepID=UPI0005FC6A3F|nr:bifunctional ADP-dependent NAD(P)H-hydrate dehydratase/NAD(P)H-hydrate epimerase [Geminocystis sp. NIES-3709]BAQ66783.1 NAD(P)HX epimerase [Geminocystis sp. NIES-3709]